MAHEGESTDHLEDLSGGGGGSRSTRVLATIVTWTISAFKTRGINIDPSFKLDRSALKRVTRVVMVLPLVNGAAALLELLSRLILLILFLALSCAPRHRTVMVERFRATMRMHVQSVRRLSSLTDVEDTSARRRKSSLPPEATVLIVGHSAVGKTALGDALHRLARKVGSQPPPRACVLTARPSRIMLTPLPPPCRSPANLRSRLTHAHPHRHSTLTGGARGRAGGCRVPRAVAAVARGVSGAQAADHRVGGGARHVAAGVRGQLHEAARAEERAAAALALSADPQHRGGGGGEHRERRRHALGGHRVAAASHAPDLRRDHSNGRAGRE